MKIVKQPERATGGELMYLWWSCATEDKLVVVLGVISLRWDSAMKIKGIQGIHGIHGKSTEEAL